jgi:hypothetical protein
MIPPPVEPPARSRRKQTESERAFLVGVLWAASFLVNAHGQDTMAAELLDGMGSVASLRRLARAEDYTFPSGFWRELNLRRERRNPSAVSHEDA